MSEESNVRTPEVNEHGWIREQPVSNPGIEEHVNRWSDEDEGASRRATAQIVACFALSPLFAIAFIVAYFAIPGPLGRNPEESYGGPIVPILGMSAQHFYMGLFLGLAIFLIGVGLVQWARRIMNDEEIAEERHQLSSSPENKQRVLEKLEMTAKDANIHGRRSVIGWSLLGALGLTALAPLVTLADAGPWPLPSTRKRTLERTLWAETEHETIYLVNDVTYERIRASDMEIGQLINGEPSNLEELHHSDPPRFQVEKAKAAIIVVRMDPNTIDITGREDWQVGGILAYSKICTHVGCPISLWEQQTHHLLCPCHQSTFDLGDHGKVVFGPAARALPQLPITVDGEGYLIAQRDFEVPVGPSYFERPFNRENDKGEY